MGKSFKIREILGVQLREFIYIYLLIKRLFKTSFFSYFRDKDNLFLGLILQRPLVEVHRFSNYRKCVYVFIYVYIISYIYRKIWSNKSCAAITITTAL